MERYGERWAEAELLRARGQLFLTREANARARRSMPSEVARRRAWPAGEGVRIASRDGACLTLAPTGKDRRRQGGAVAGDRVMAAGSRQRRLARRARALRAALADPRTNCTMRPRRPPRASSHQGRNMHPFAPAVSFWPCRHRHARLGAGKARCAHDEGFRRHVSGECGNNAAPKATVFADALVFLNGDKRIAGSNVQSAASFYGPGQSSEFRTVLLSETPAHNCASRCTSTSPAPT